MAGAPNLAHRIAVVAVDDTEFEMDVRSEDGGVTSDRDAVQTNKAVGVANIDFYTHVHASRATVVTIVLIMTVAFLCLLAV